MSKDSFVKCNKCGFKGYITAIEKVLVCPRCNSRTYRDYNE
jgi:Archaea-specific RecJ-like exonuclease, contains DnaJ-type Zn finger domain